MSPVLWGGEGSWGKYWNQRVSGFKVINLFDSDWRRWHRVNYSAKGHQAFLMGLCREGWVIRTCSLLWLIHTRGPDRPTVMQAPLWTNCHVSGWPWSGNTDRWDAFYMLLPSSSSGLVKPGRLEKNKVKGDCCFMSNSATHGWAGVQARLRMRLTRRPWESRSLFLYPESWKLKQKVHQSWHLGDRLLWDNAMCLGRWVGAWGTKFAKAKTGWARPLSEMWEIQQNGLVQGSVNYGSTYVFINKVLLEYQHAHLFTYCLWLPYCYSGRTALPW